MGNVEESNVNEDSQILHCQAEVLKSMLLYIESLALRSTVELRIPDIIHSHGQPMSLSHIASKIDSPSPNVAWLSRVIRFLVHKKIFTVDDNQSSGEALYGLTPSSRWLLHDQELSLAPMLLTITHPWMIAPWNEVSRSIKEGGDPFKKANGQTIWERGLVDPSFNDLVNTGMKSVTKMCLNDILMGYKEGFSEIEGTLVDVGGGMGQAVAEIVKAHPHIKGINFDAPHVVATAPECAGITHVGGDMFKEVPTANAIFIKSVLHDWEDEDCLKILRNCYKVVSEKKGKLIIVDVVINPKGNGLFDETKLLIDLCMMAITDGGRERTEADFNKLLKEAGFARHNVIKIPSYLSIIEAFPH